ncbi:MAG: 23S rRNA (adenine(2030)-N(6))-methyltransferase RlmJ [Alphaproteobacteria bacterium]
MNYRHIYHAGNICDVVKHAVLTLMLGHLREKEKGFFILDTHAGIGRYDLEEPRAQKTGEAQDGILKLLAAPYITGISDYYASIRKINPDVQSLRYYPGSPLLATLMMRPQDRYVGCEFNREEYHELRRLLENNPQAHIHHRDGYEALQAFLPPEEKRGLVLIDPPFESPDEFKRITEAIHAHKRWPQGQYLIWYPIKERPALWRFHEVLTATGIPKQLCAEFLYEEETRHDRLNGCGLILINPPWQMDKKLEALFPALHEALGTSYKGSSIKWLTPE